MQQLTPHQEAIFGAPPTDHDHTRIIRIDSEGNEHFLQAFSYEILIDGLIEQMARVHKKVYPESLIVIVDMLTGEVTI